MKTFLCDKSVLCQNKRNTSHLTQIITSFPDWLQCKSSATKSLVIVFAGRISSEVGKSLLGIALWLLFCSSANTHRIFHSTPLYTINYMQHNFYLWHDSFLQFSLPGPPVLECRDLCCNSSFSKETCCFCAFLMAFIFPFSLCLVSHFSRS